jgi:addiction module HigA family antidote
MSDLEKYPHLEYTHPGLLLKKDLDEVDLSVYRVSKETGISQVNLSKILKGKRAISPDTGLRLAKFWECQKTILSVCRYDMTLRKPRWQIKLFMTR